MDREELFSKIKNSWSYYTAYGDDPDWVEDGWPWDGTKSKGQCLITSLVLQDYLGGTIIKGRVDGTVHFWLDVDGENIDITFDQFSKGVYSCVPTPITRTAAIYYKDTTKERYEELKRRVEKC